MVAEAPRYGGSLTTVKKHDDVPVDAWFSGSALSVTSSVVEKLAIVDWAIDRSTYPFLTGYTAPLFALRPALAESWEQPDPLTYVFHVGEGARWHNKAPMNGRQLTAQDIEYNYHRLFGMGKFTEKSPAIGPLGNLPIESIEATDDMTVVFKLSEPRYQAAQLIMDWANAVIQPPEVIEAQGGSIDNWQDLVGTGPYMLVDWVKGSSFTDWSWCDTWSRTPSYRWSRWRECRCRSSSAGRSSWRTSSICRGWGALPLPR